MRGKSPLSTRRGGIQAPFSLEGSASRRSRRRADQPSGTSDEIAHLLGLDRLSQSRRKSDQKAVLSKQGAGWLVASPVPRRQPTEKSTPIDDHQATWGVPGQAKKGNAREGSISDVHGIGNTSIQCPLLPVSGSHRYRSVSYTHLT